MAISLVLGGASSGKSFFAEQLIKHQQPIYIATSESGDAEMADKIKQHQKRRGDKWQAIEQPLALLDAISQNANNENAILVDCLSMWLSNLMMGERDVASEISALVDGLAKLTAYNIVLVSNEVGHGIVPVNVAARQFRQFSGRLNQEVAKIAEHVYFVVAGIGQKIK